MGEDKGKKRKGGCREAGGTEENLSRKKGSGGGRLEGRGGGRGRAGI